MRMKSLAEQNKAMVDALETVLWDVENQDQNPVNENFVVICDSTVELCRKALKGEK